MEEVIERLQGIISWSDRLGSDEIFEIKEIINELKKLKDEK